MSCAIVNSGSGTTSIALTGVTAGNLLVMHIRWTGNTGATCSVTDGTSSFTMGAVTTQSTNRTQFGYLLSANSGNKTYTVTFESGADTQRIEIYEVSHTGAITYDTLAGASGSGTAAASPTINTASALSIVFSGGGNLSTQYSAPKIGGAAVLGEVHYNNYNYLGYITYTSLQTGIAASHTCAGSLDDWMCNIIAFSEASSGPSIPVLQASYRRLRA